MNVYDNDKDWTRKIAFFSYHFELYLIKIVKINNKYELTNII